MGACMTTNILKLNLWRIKCDHQFSTVNVEPYICLTYNFNFLYTTLPAGYLYVSCSSHCV